MIGVVIAYVVIAIASFFFGKGVARLSTRAQKAKWNGADSSETFWLVYETGSTLFWAIVIATSLTILAVGE